MRRYQAGISGTDAETPYGWDTIRLDDFWKKIIKIFNPGPKPKNIQQIALGNYQILENRRNLIVSSPTNSGKSLLGWLVLLEAVRRGKRAILLEPLRAIAREKYDELCLVQKDLSKIFGQKIEIRITTGDYRLDDEWLTSPPPTKGEIIIATPERLDALLRNPVYEQWFSSIGAVCLDEAHLIGSRKRGATFEYLITTMLSLDNPPRIILLSATLGNTDDAQEWLSPCDVIVSRERTPQLIKEVIELEAEENSNQIVVDLAKEILEDPENYLLIFVYQTKSAEYLSRELDNQTGKSVGKAEVLHYHSKMHSTMRLTVKKKFTDGVSRCIVTTTALGLGVNMPATHVIVRDVTFPGVGRVGIDQITQMMGRAGRGARKGHAFALVRSNDGWVAGELASSLIVEEMPNLVSQFTDSNNPYVQYAEAQNKQTLSASLIGAYLSRYKEQGKGLDEIRSFFALSLGGRYIVNQVSGAIDWLVDTNRVLAFLDENGKYRLTVLGQRSIQSMLPIEIAGGIGQFLRDLLSVDRSGQLIENLQPLDHLIILNLLHKDKNVFRPFSKSMVNDVDAWIESHPHESPLLYKKWFRGKPDTSHAQEVLGSLGLSLEGKGIYSEWAYKQSYLATFNSIVLYERGLGTSEVEIERKWSVKNIGGVEERWRDEYLWLLSGVEKILDLRCFYYHLKETCSASDEQIQQTKKAIKRLHYQVLELQEILKYCSPLGPVLRSIRKSSRSTVGIKTIRRLEDAGITSLAELAKLSKMEMEKLGIRKSLATQIFYYCQKRSL